MQRSLWPISKGGMSEGERRIRGALAALGQLRQDSTQSGGAISTEGRLQLNVRNVLHFRCLLLGCTPHAHRSPVADFPISQSKNSSK